MHEAVDKILAVDGEVDAMFYVAGKPVELFAEWHNNPARKQRLATVHFVPIEYTILNAAITTTGSDAGRFGLLSVPSGKNCCNCGLQGIRSGAR